MTVIHCPRLFDSLDGKMLGQTSILISGDKRVPHVPLLGHGFVEGNRYRVGAPSKLACSSRCKSGPGKA